MALVLLVSLLERIRRRPEGMGENYVNGSLSDAYLEVCVLDKFNARERGKLGQRRKSFSAILCHALPGAVAHGGKRKS